MRSFPLLASVSRRVVVGCAASTVAALTLVSPATAKSVKLSEVAKDTAAVKTMTFTMRADMTMSVAGKNVKGTFTGSGMVDRTKNASSMTVNMGEFMKAIMGSSGQKMPPQLADPKNGAMRVIAIGDKMWMSYPLLTMMTGEASSKPWIMMDAKSLGVDSGDLLGAQGGVDPSQGLEFLYGISDTARQVGTEKVEGVNTTKFDATITADALTKRLPAKDAIQLKSMMGGNSMPVSVWIDDQNRARRMDMTIKVSQQTGAMTMKTSYIFSKFGEPVSIAPPPSNQIGENPILAAAMKQAAEQRKAMK